MSALISRTAIIMLMINSAAVVGKTCGIGQYLNRRGKCRDCKMCPLGEGMNFSMEAAPNTCHPCKKCPDGYYNDPDYGQYECIMCRLNCAIMNRKEYEPCGGTKPGICGGCINSSYEDRENNLDSPCTKKTETVASEEPETNAKVLSQEDGELKGDQNSRLIVNNHKESVAGIVITSVAVTGTLLVSALVVFVIRTKRKSTPRRNYVAPEQSRTLLESTDSINEGVGKEKYNIVDLDLETDGPGTTKERNAYGELQIYNSAGPSGFHVVSETSSTDVREPPRTYPNTIVTIGDKYFTYLSKHLCGGAVSEVFRALEVRDQNIFAELELYRLERIKYQDAIYRLLLHWCRLKTKDATLDVICPILDQAGLCEIAKKLLTLFLEESSSNTENQANKIMAYSETDHTVISYSQTNNSLLEEPAQYVDRQSGRFEQGYPQDLHSLHSLSLLSCDEIGENEDEE